MNSLKTNFQDSITFGTRWLSHLAAVALGIMIVVTCLDVILRLVKIPFAGHDMAFRLLKIASTGDTFLALRLYKFSLTGAYDIVCVSTVIAIACALPATTAAKGHIAIAYFSQKLNRVGRRVVEVCVHGGLIASFLVAMWQCLRAGNNFLSNGQGTATLQIPLFWVPWVMALGLLFSALASMVHLTQVFENQSQSKI